jgi:hypothetical protein
MSKGHPSFAMPTDEAIRNLLLKHGLDASDETLQRAKSAYDNFLFHHDPSENPAQLSEAEIRSSVSAVQTLLRKAAAVLSATQEQLLQELYQQLKRETPSDRGRSNKDWVRSICDCLHDVEVAPLLPDKIGFRKGGVPTLKLSFFIDACGLLNAPYSQSRVKGALLEIRRRRESFPF